MYRSPITTTHSNNWSLTTNTIEGVSIMHVISFNITSTPLYTYLHLQFGIVSIVNYLPSFTPSSSRLIFTNLLSLNYFHFLTHLTRCFMLHHIYLSGICTRLTHPPVRKGRPETVGFAASLSPVFNLQIYFILLINFEAFKLKLCLLVFYLQLLILRKRMPSF